MATFHGECYLQFLPVCSGRASKYSQCARERGALNNQSCRATRTNQASSRARQEKSGMEGWKIGRMEGWSVSFGPQSICSLIFCVRFSDDEAIVPRAGRFLILKTFRLDASRLSNHPLFHPSTLPSFHPSPSILPRYPTLECSSSSTSLAKNNPLWQSFAYLPSNSIN
jgi:hypothetical protein